MTWWEVLFASIWVLIQGLLWLAALVVVAFIVVILFATAWDKLKERKEPSREKLLNTAEATAVSLYRLKPDQSHVTAFVQGADYMWEHLHPNKK